MALFDIANVSDPGFLRIAGEHIGTPKGTRIRAADDGVASIDDRQRPACVVSLGNIDRGT